MAESVNPLDRMTVLLAVSKDKVDQFKLLLQDELSEPMSPISRVLTEDRLSITHEHIELSQVYRETDESMSWEDMMTSYEGDIIFVYNPFDEELVLLFNHGLLDGMTAVEVLVKINGCKNIRSLEDMPALYNNPITITKAALHYGRRITLIKEQPRVSPIFGLYKGAQFIRDTIEYAGIKEMKTAFGVSYTAMMTKTLLCRFNLDLISGLKVMVSLANRPRLGILNNISFIQFDYEPEMTPKDIDAAIESKAWEAPIVSTALHNLPTTPGGGAFADVLISLVPGQVETEGRLFHDAFVFSRKTTMPLYICCVRYGDRISVGGSFSDAVVNAEITPQAPPPAWITEDVPDAQVLPTIEKHPASRLRSIFNTVTCGIPLPTSIFGRSPQDS